MGGDFRSQELRHELEHSVPMKDRALDGSPPDHLALGSIEPVDTCGEQRLNCGRHCNLGEIARRDPMAIFAAEQASVDQHRQHFLDEKGIALSRLSKSPKNCLGKLRVPEEVFDQNVALFLDQRLKQDRGRVHLPSAPGGTLVEQLRACKAEQQDRCVLSPVVDMFDEVEKRRFGPLKVVEDDDERPRLRERLEQFPDTPERLFGGCWGHGEPDGVRNSFGDRQRLRRTANSDSIFSRARSGASSSRRSAAFRTISTIGQKVIPSP